MMDSINMEVLKVSLSKVNHSDYDFVISWLGPVLPQVATRAVNGSECTYKTQSWTHQGVNDSLYQILAR